MALASSLQVHCQAFCNTHISATVMAHGYVHLDTWRMVYLLDIEIVENTSCPMIPLWKFIGVREVLW